MGLDMYLYRKTYVQNWAHQPPEKRHTITYSGPHDIAIQPERIAYITEQVAYWRKANAIHSWFVVNAQGGKDDCESYHVTRDQLQALLDAVEIVLSASEYRHWDDTPLGGHRVERECKEADATFATRKFIREVKDTEVASSVLPTQSGFFFGSTAYDEWYIKDLEYTRETLTALLTEEDCGEFYYESSW